MEKDFEAIELFELYNGLLSSRQKQIAEAYYVYDLSIAEIAENLGATRQSVFDAIKKAKTSLLNFEKILKMREKNQKLIEVSKSVQKSCPSVAEEILKIIGE